MTAPYQGNATVMDRLKADVQKPMWVTKKMMDNNRFMYWSDHDADLSANSLSYVGHDMKSGTNWTPIQWFNTPWKVTPQPMTLAAYQLVAQKKFPLQSPFGKVRGSQALSDSWVGPDFVFPGHDWMRKAKVAVAGKQGFDGVVHSGTWTRVVYAKHRFSWANYSRHPVTILCVYQTHTGASNSASVVDMLNDSLTEMGPELVRLPNVTVLNVPGAFDNEGSQPGRSYYDIDFSPKEFNKENYDKSPIGGLASENGLWRFMNVSDSEAFNTKQDANGVWEDSHSPFETEQVDTIGTDSAAFVSFFARFNMPMANVSMPAFSPKVESDPSELTDAYKLLNMHVKSRFLNEIRSSEAASGYTGKDYRAVPTAV